MTDKPADTAMDHANPDGKWAFNDGVTDVFDDMLARSIPDYAVMRSLCFQLATKFVKKGTDIIDVGCSRGEALVPLIDRYGAQNHFIGLEVSPPMLKAARERFAGLINVHVVDIRECDLRTDFPGAQASVILCVLSLQFTPLEYRQTILQRMYDSLLPGGALILVEKVLGASALLDKHLVELYYDLKRQNGYSEDQIQRKRLALEGVLVPLPAKMNEEMLHMTGYRQVDCFWRNLNFAGWVGVR